MFQSCNHKSNSNNALVETENIISNDIQVALSNCGLNFRAEVLTAKDISHCNTEKDKSIILQVADFLNERNYNAETEGEFSISFKKAMYNFCKENGIPNAEYNRQQLKEIFMVDMNSIEAVYCKCLEYAANKNSTYH